MCGTEYINLKSLKWLSNNTLVLRVVSVKCYHNMGVNMGENNRSIACLLVGVIFFSARFKEGKIHSNPK